MLNTLIASNQWRMVWSVLLSYLSLILKVCRVQGASPPSSQVSSAAIVKVIREINFPAEESLVVQRADNTGSSAIVTSMTRVADGGSPWQFAAILSLATSCLCSEL